MDEPQQQPRKATWRMGARQRERLQWTVVALICFLLFLALRPYYLHIVQTRDFQTCQSNMLQIAGALGRYEQDWDSKLPTGSQWTDNLQALMAARSGTGFKVTDIFHCPLDTTGAPSSYAYNDLLSGMGGDAISTDKSVQDRLGQIGRYDRAPLIIEKHGSKRNATVKLHNWQEVAKDITRPHLVPIPTGSVIMGSGKPSSVNDEQLSNRTGPKF